MEEELIERIAKALDIPLEAITELEQGSAINIVSSNLTANDILQLLYLYDFRIISWNIV